jgi:hypothetical protein
MGALTAKKHAFTFRSWEPKTFKEIDETEVKLYYIRTEHLKVKRSRILPINYWMSDKKRFAPTDQNNNYPMGLFNHKKIFKLTYNLIEEKYSQYLISNYEGYRRICDKIVDATTNNIACFFAKQLPKNIPFKFKFYDDIITNNIDYYRTAIDNFDIINGKKILLLTNQKIESPALNAWLYKNIDNYDFTSLSTFSSNIQKEEIPFSQYIYDQIFQKGYYELTNTTIITSTTSSPVNNISSCPHIIIKPLYLNQKYNSYNKYEDKKTLFTFFKKDRKTFDLSFVTSTLLLGHTQLCLQPNSFDHFIQKKISNKYLERLILLYNLIRLEKKVSTYLIKNMTTMSEEKILFIMI